MTILQNKRSKYSHESSPHPASVEASSSNDKLAALGLFVAGTAQEIKHPLQVILAHTQKLLHKYKSRGFEYISFREFSEIMKTLENINQQIKHCCDITNKLLVLNKKRAGLKERGCDINTAIRGSLSRIMRELTLVDVRLSLHLAKGLPRAAIDSVEFDHVLTNVVANAIQSMPTGGRLVVRTFYNHKSQSVCAEFKDTGVGITKENLSRVFEPFFTTKQKDLGENLGLGLSVVHSIIKGSRGDIQIKSSLRGGTLVMITLPIYKKGA